MNFRRLAAALCAAAYTLPAAAHGPSDPAHQSYAMGEFKLESGQAIRDFSISCAGSASRIKISQFGNGSTDGAELTDNVVDEFGKLFFNVQLRGLHLDGLKQLRKTMGVE